jgi:GNAT superfamily N-acetyltransferase
MGEIEYRDFDGDLEALAAMARESWFEEYGVATWPDLYQPALSRHYFADVDDPRFLVGAYDGGRLVAFVANLPRPYRFNGKRYRGVMSCMLVGHRDYRRRGLARGLIAECLRRNEEVGCDFALMTLEKKHRSALLFEKHMKPHHRIEVMKRMYPIARPVDLEKLMESENLKGYETAAIVLLGAHRPVHAPPVSGTVRTCRDEDLAPILDLIGCYPDANSLVRVFDRASLARRLHTEDVTSTVVYERGGGVRGFINYTALDMLSRRGRYRWAWLDFLHWEGLSGREKKALLAGLWASARDHGCIGILEWNKNYYAKGALFRSRFFAYPRFIDLNAWIFNPGLSLKGISSVFEQVI